jgi:hypothetical protein
MGLGISLFSKVGICNFLDKYLVKYPIKVIA